MKKVNIEGYEDSFKNLQKQISHGVSKDFQKNLTDFNHNFFRSERAYSFANLQHAYNILLLLQYAIDHNQKGMLFSFSSIIDDISAHEAKHDSAKPKANDAQSNELILAISVISSAAIYSQYGPDTMEDEGGPHYY